MPEVQQSSLSPQRIRDGLLVLVAGVVLMLAVVVMWTIRFNSAIVLAQKGGAADGIDPNLRSLSLPIYLAVLIFGGLLLLLFLFASYALVRSSRRYHEWLGKKRRRATPTSDVWAMHKLPPEDESPEEPSSDEPK